MAVPGDWPWRCGLFYTEQQRGGWLTGLSQLPSHWHTRVSWARADGHRGSGMSPFGTKRPTAVRSEGRLAGQTCASWRDGQARIRSSTGKLVEKRADALLNERKK